MSVLRCLAFIFLVIFTLPGMSATASETIEQAKRHLQAGQADQAYQLLDPLQDELAGKPDYDYLLGIAALDSGRPTQAVFALERVLAVDPDHVLARAEIARAYLALREFEVSKQEFETVQKSTIPPQARATIEKYLTAFDNVSDQKTRWKSYLAATLGFDTNVNSATSSGEVALPLFGGAIARLDRRGTEASDQFGAVSGGATVYHRLRKNLALLAGVNGNLLRLADEKTFETASMSGYAGVDLTRGQNIYTLALQADHFRLDDDAFRNSVGIQGQVRRPLDDSSQVTAYAQASRVTYHQQEIRNVNRYVAGAAYSHIFSGEFSPSVYAGIYAGKEAENASGVEHLGHTLGGVRAGGRMALNTKTSLFISGEVERRNFGGTDPLFLKQRHETRYSLNLGGEYTLPDNWIVSPTIGYTRSLSNITINTYSRTVLSVTLRKNFN